MLNNCELNQLTFIYLIGTYNTYSAYCLGNDCRSLHPSGICHNSQPHQAQGCVLQDNVNWDQVVNIRNYTGTSREDCVWMCKDLEGEGVALSR